MRHNKLYSAITQLIDIKPKYIVISAWLKMSFSFNLGAANHIYLVVWCN